jgi:hypothetical protein
MEARDDLNSKVTKKDKNAIKVAVVAAIVAQSGRRESGAPIVLIALLNCWFYEESFTADSSPTAKEHVCSYQTIYG